jgi:uncharacterized protein involved in response to NO
VIKPPTVFDLGFRVFFLCAGVHSVLIVGLWSLVYFGWLSLPATGLNPFQWHAHEMVFGYSLAVIAGFLLTATANWTGLTTLHGWPLAGLAALWLLARLLFLAGLIVPAEVFEMLFIAFLFLAVASPILRVRQSRQTGILGKLVLFFPAVLVFLLGALGILQGGVQLGNYAALYLVVGLILMMGRRVVPLFIKSGVDEDVAPGNPHWLDIASLLVFLVFFVAVLVPAGNAVSGWTALALFVINAWRLLMWHTPGIWRKPLVWVIYLGLWFVTLGFLLHFLASIGEVSAYLAIHAFSYGGIGLMTLGMMSRVSLGHTGRSIHTPPPAIQVAFGILLLGAILRTLLPLLLPAGFYGVLIGLSQALWMLAFALFVVVFTPMLLAPRADAATAAAG